MKPTALSTAFWAFAFFFLASAATSTSTAADDKGHTLHLNLNWAASGWQKGQRVPGDRVITVTLAMSAAEDGIRQAVAALETMSNPQSKTFGKYMSVNKTNNLFAPAAEQVKATVQWLSRFGILTSGITVSGIGHNISFNTTVTLAEKIFSAIYHEFAREGEIVLASETVYLPEQVSAYVDFVLPGAELPATGRVFLPTLGSVEPLPPLSGGGVKARQNTGDTVDCFKYMTPACVRSLYNMPKLKGNETFHPNNSFGIYQPAWLTWLSEDLDEFFTHYQPELVGQRPNMLRINGGYLQRDYQILPFNLEPNLDFEYTMALAHPLPVTNIQVGDQFLLGNFNTMLAGFSREYCETGLDPSVDPIYPDTVNPGGYNASDCGTHQPPLVISISYGSAEASYSERYARRQCLEYLKLGLRGVSVIVSSGDYGTEQLSGTCIDPVTGGVLRNATNSGGGFFAPTFPASCPWVTAVGGTQLKPTMNKTWNEDMRWDEFPEQVVWSSRDAFLNYSSAGGFSWVFERPEYQRDAVTGYLGFEPASTSRSNSSSNSNNSSSNGSTNSNSSSEHAEHLRALSEKGYFNPRGRGFPDVSATAANVIIRTNGAWYLVGGTSASAPIFASMIARINDERLKSGKGPVGFLNPVLYSEKAKRAFKDVKEGWNGGCGVERAFPATKGWDAVTGLGTPDFQALRDVYLALP